MIAWVLYDIENDKARTKVARICKQTGLYRVQYSVFLGTIDAEQRDTRQRARPVSGSSSVASSRSRTGRRSYCSRRIGPPMRHWRR